MPTQKPRFEQARLPELFALTAGIVFLALAVVSLVLGNGIEAGIFGAGTLLIILHAGIGVAPTREDRETAAPAEQ